MPSVRGEKWGDPGYEGILSVGGKENGTFWGGGSEGLGDDDFCSEPVWTLGTLLTRLTQ